MWRAQAPRLYRGGRGEGLRGAWPNHPSGCAAPCAALRPAACLHCSSGRVEAALHAVVQGDVGVQRGLLCFSPSQRDVTPILPHSRYAFSGTIRSKYVFIAHTRRVVPPVRMDRTGLQHHLASVRSPTSRNGTVLLGQTRRTPATSAPPASMSAPAGPAPAAGGMREASSGLKSAGTGQGAD